MELKQVIFIGGTSYSGSTFFDMMLANDAKGFSCGEVYALFYPHRPHHYNVLCGCGVYNCTNWEKILRNGEKKLFQSISDLDPNIQFIVVSSKQIFWQIHQMNILKKSKLEYKNILIWKDPYEFACSYIKRGRTEWERDWIKYHRMYFTNIKRWKSVKYKDIAKKKDTLKKVCAYLEIPFYDDKHHFWNKTQHTLFGNQSAKIHLYDKNDNKYKKIKNELEHDNKERIETNHKSIYYNQSLDDELKNKVEERIKKNFFLRKIIKQLENNDISNSGYNYDDIHKLFYCKLTSNLNKGNYLMTTKYRGLKSYIMPHK